MKRVSNNNINTHNWNFVLTNDVLLQIRLITIEDTTTDVNSKQKEIIRKVEAAFLFFIYTYGLKFMFNLSGLFTIVK